MELPYLPFSTKRPFLGTTVLMAGYSDELELPFSFDKKLDYRKPEVVQQIPNIKIAQRRLMIKSGIIGHRTVFDFHGANTDLALTGDIFYVDNGMHIGCSGGPVIDEDGNLIGIIVQRAITDASSREISELQVPSGSTVAITPHVLLPFIDWPTE